MTRKTGSNKSGNATVAAVQQHSIAANHNAKAAPAPAQAQGKNATKQTAAPAPAVQAWSQVATPKPALDQAKPKVQAAPAKVQAALSAKPVTPAKPASAQMKAANPQAHAQKNMMQKEDSMLGDLFAEPESWTRSLTPATPPARSRTTSAQKPAQAAHVSPKAPAQKAAPIAHASPKMAPAHASPKMAPAHASPKMAPSHASPKMAPAPKAALISHASPKMAPAAVSHASSKMASAQKSAQTAHAAPKKAAPVKKFDMGPGYEMHMIPSMFQESQSWLNAQRPSQPPHRSPIQPTLMKQQSATHHHAAPAATAQIKPSSAPASKTVSKTKTKVAINFKSAAGKQIVLRQGGSIIVFQPLWKQVYRWAVRIVREQERHRGRSSAKGTKAQLKQQVKERIAAQRKGPASAVAMKPLSRQASDASNVIVSSKIVKGPLAPLKSTIILTPKAGHSRSASSKADWRSNVWEDYYTSKHSTYVEPPKAKSMPSSASKASTKAPAAAPAPRAAPNKSSAPAQFAPSWSYKSAPKVHEAPDLKPHIPPPKTAKSAAIFSFIAPSEAVTFRYNPIINKDDPGRLTHDAVPVGPAKAEQSLFSWMGPQGVAVASAAVVIGGIAISQFLS